MADEAIQIVLTGRIDSKIATNIRNIADEALRADTALEELKATLKSFSAGNGISTYSTDVKQLRQELANAVRDQKALAAATNTAATSLRSAGTNSNKLASELKKVEANTGRATAQFTNMRGIMSNLVGTFASFFAIQQWAQASDAMKSYENRLKVVGLEGDKLDKTLGRISEAALRNGQSMDGLTQLYQKVASAGKDIGASQSEMLNFIDAVAAGLRIQGASATTANGALIQLAQGIGAARVEAQEFNSIVEAAYPLAQAAAKGIDGFAGSVNKLQSFIRSGGTITGAQLFQGILKGLDDLQGKVAKTELTIGQSLQNLRTRFELWTRSTAEQSGLVAKAINFIGENLTTIIPVIGAFGAAWLTIKAFSIITEIVGGIVALVRVIQMGAAAVLLFTSPWALLAAAILAVVVALAIVTGTMDGLIKTVGGFTGKLWESVTAQTGFKDIAGEAQAAATKLDQGFAGITSSAQGMTTATNDNKAAVNSWSKSVVTDVNKVVSAYNMLLGTQREAAAAAGAAQFAKNNPGAGNTKTSGSFTTIGAGANNNGGSFKRFAAGGSFKVNGKSGVDKNLVQFRAKNGERVDVLTTAQQRAQEENRKRQSDSQGSSPVFVFNITTPDADSFRLSRQQMANDTYAALA